PLDDARALASLADHKACVGEFVQRTLGGDARDTEFGAKILLAGNQVAGRQFAAIDAVAQDDKELMVKGDAAGRVKLPAPTLHPSVRNAHSFQAPLLFLRLMVCHYTIMSIGVGG